MVMAAPTDTVADVEVAANESGGVGKWIRGANLHSRKKRSDKKF